MQAKVCASRNVKERHAKCVCAVCCVLCTQHWALYKNERKIKQQQKNRASSENAKYTMHM